ncbi:hypothetical protein [Methylosinus sp. PW1]|uniref:hypothetical protein n=1 Tax=Methylosinus sp. PW1 TaxID=107636 RepID=UPI00068A737C|nr:hypothetical protein [Methylosinus sp. PW1]
MFPIAFPAHLAYLFRPLPEAPREGAMIELEDMLWRDLREARLARDAGNLHDLRFHILRLSALEPPPRLPRRARLRMIMRRNEAVLSLGKELLALADAARAPRAMEG